jgi:hypothetical protein
MRFRVVLSNGMFSSRITTDRVSCLVIHRQNIMTNNAYGYHDLDPPYSVPLIHAYCKMTNTQTEWSLRELSVPTAMKLFQTDRAYIVPCLNDMATIWQQSYTFVTPVIKSGPLSVRKSLYAQLIICIRTKELWCDAYTSTTTTTSRRTQNMVGRILLDYQMNTF